jgi:hypothetical protein
MIKLELTIEQINTILAALGKQPFEAVAGVINEIQKQGGPQAAALEKADAEAAKNTK